MRENLCQHDIQSREIREYFLRYLHDKTDHFIHEFYNFAISPYDIVGYDRNVDYSSREQPSVATVEISSNESSDGEVQVIDEAGSSGAVRGEISPENITEVVLVTTGAQEESCIINDVHASNIAEDVPAASLEVVVESSDSECQFVLALKPPHLRTPEQVSLDSCSDSDVVYIPNESQQPGTFSSDSDDPEDNKPLSETRKQLKSEMDEAKFDVNLDLKEDPNIKIDENINLLNYGASTSTASQPDENTTNQKKFYYPPIRKRIAEKSIFDSSSSSSSSESETSDEEWQSKMVSKTESKHSKSSKTRRKNSRKLKKRRVSSTIVSHPKPLSELPSSEEAPGDNDTSVDYPRVKTVIIKKHDDQHYIQKTSNSDLSAE